MEVFILDGVNVVEYLFIASCVIFIVTVTWLSYKLGQTKAVSAKLSCVIGFFLSFLPPLALIYIGFLAFKNDANLSQ